MADNKDPNAAQRNPGPNGTPQAQTPAPENTALTDMGSQFGPNPSYDNSLLYYPENISSSQDRVVISQFQYVAGKLETNSVLGGSLGNREYEFAQQAAKNTLGTVTLPMVNNLTETNQTGWGEDSLSTIAAALMAGGTRTADEAAIGNIIGALQTGTSTLLDTVKDDQVRKRATQYFITKFAASLIAKGGIQINPEAYITRATGTIINPNMELLFNGPKLRSFGLDFKLTPRSQNEAKNIRAIIKFFKKGMAPRRGNNTAGTFFLGTPNIFSVRFQSGSNELKSLVEYKTCALITCQVNYTPDGFYAAYNDSTAGGSQPIAVTLQLGFAELTPVFSDDYDVNVDSVGPDRAQFEQKYTPQAPQQEPPKQTLTQEQLADREGRVPTIPQRRPVAGGRQRAESFGAGISNIERYEAAKAKGFSGTFQQFLNTQR